MAAKVKLHVENLTVSFRTAQGMVRAVRGVSFELFEGETLAIVGESGSGKSVSSRAIMGILAGNAVIDAGKIIYEGQDLTKVDEENFHELRGKKIGMIFQDPTSSLNPIMKIGYQITEGMLLNGNRLKNKVSELVRDKKAVVNQYVSQKASLLEEYKKQLANAAQPDSNLNKANLKAELQKELLALKPLLKQAEATLAVARAEAKKAVASDWNSEQTRVKGLILQVQGRPLPSFGNVDKVKAKQEIKTLKENLKIYQSKLLAKQKENTTVSKEIAKKNFQEAWQTELNRVTNLINDIKTQMGLPAKLKREELAKRHLEISTYQENLRRYKKMTKSEAYERAIDIMKEVGIPNPEKRFNQYPFQFSGGMKQRIVVAIAITANPDVLICDEPTTALDVTIQAQILELINKIKAERNLSVIFITHDLGVVANMADRIAVMYAGKIVEIGTSSDIFYNPRHPYTWALLGSMPDLDSRDRLIAIPGTPPNMLYPPKGDAFAERNKYAMKIDFEQEPPMFSINETHSAATWLLHKDAPKVEIPDVVKARISRMLDRTKEVKR